MFFSSLFKSKTVTNKQALAIGFVLALLSMLTLGVTLVLMPLFGAWMNMNGVMELDFFYTAFIFIFVMATQALILFGFPLYYAKDQKSHMTGFRILLCTLLWMLALMILLGSIFVQMNRQTVDTYDLDSFGTVMEEPVSEVQE